MRYSLSSPEKIQENNIYYILKRLQPVFLSSETGFLYDHEHGIHSH